MIPNFTHEFLDWHSTVKLLIKERQNIDYEWKITNTKTVDIKAIIQSLSKQKLMTKPIEQRSFEWMQLHHFSQEQDFRFNDIVVYKDKEYIVRAILDKRENGFMEYDLCESFTEEVL